MRAFILAVLVPVAFAAEVSQAEQDRIWQEAMKQSAAQVARPVSEAKKPAPVDPVVQVNGRYSMESQYRRVIDSLCVEALSIADAVTSSATPREALAEADSVAEMTA